MLLLPSYYFNNNNKKRVLPGVHAVVFVVLHIRRYLSIFSCILFPIIQLLDYNKSILRYFIRNYFSLSGTFECGEKNSITYYVRRYLSIFFFLYFPSYHSIIRLHIKSLYEFKYKYYMIQMIFY